MEIDSVIFYQDTLGLELEYQQDNEYVSFIFSNQIRLGIKKSSHKREIPGAQTVIIGVKDIETIFTKLKEKDCHFYQELQSHEWGKDFAIFDPDGNKIEFLQR